MNNSGNANAKKRTPWSRVFLSEAIFNEYIAKDSHNLTSLILKINSSINTIWHVI